MAEDSPRDSRITVLMVHGAWHGPWCWEDHWTEHFTAAGHDVRAVALDRHRTPGSKKRIWPSVGAYVRTVERVIDEVDGEVVLVGHSMGGLVTQRVIETRQVKGAVLVASVPARGVLGATLRTLRRAPVPTLRTIATMNMRHLVATKELVREGFYTEDTDAEVVADTLARLQNESYRAYLSMIVRWPKPKRVASPVLVLAGELDGLFTVSEEQRLARAYHSEAVVIEGAGHNLMLDSGWRDAADVTIDWMNSLG